MISLYFFTKYLGVFGGLTPEKKETNNIFLLDISAGKWYRSDITCPFPGRFKVAIMAKFAEDACTCGYVRKVTDEFRINVPEYLTKTIVKFVEVNIIHLFGIRTNKHYYISEKALLEANKSQM